MRKLLPLVLSTLLLYAGELIPLKVEKVEVFLEGARIYAKAQLQKGLNEIGPLPADASQIVISETEAKIEEIENNVFPEPALKLHSQIIALEQELSSLRSKLHALKMQISSCRKASNTLSEKIIPLGYSGWKQLQEKIAARLAELSGQYDRLSSQERKLSRRLSRLRSRYEAMIKPFRRAKKIVINSAAPAALSLRFTTSQISWMPLYRLDFSMKGKLNLRMLARVQANTFLKLKNVSISLLTAAPVVEHPPQLSPWIVDFFVPLRKIPEKAMALAAMPGMAPKKEIEKIARRGVYQEFHLGKKSLSFGHNRLLLLQARLPQKLEWRAYAKRTGSVFIFAHISNATEMVLPEAEATYFLDGVFLRRGLLRTLQPGEKVSIYVGTDPALRVKYRKLPEKRKKGWRKQKLSFSYFAEISNLSSEEKKVVLLDNLPVSAREEIKIKIQCEPRPDELDSKTGMAKWHLSIPPSGKVKVSVGVEITYPKDREIILSY